MASRQQFRVHVGSFWDPFGEPWGGKSREKGVLKKGPKNGVERGGVSHASPTTNAPGDPYKQSFLEPQELQGTS